jgi:hypothetical protein
MSGIFVIAPVLAVAPVVFSATSAVAAPLGFALASQALDQVRELMGETAESEQLVQFDVADARGLTQLVSEQGPLVLQRADAVVCFRAGKGRVQMTVTSPIGKSREELSLLGHQVLGAINQQYAYHAVMADLKTRGFDKVEEVKDEDGTIRLRMRRWD